MKRINPTLAVVLTLTLTWPVAALEDVLTGDGDDQPYVDTPTSLLELLPEGGVDGMDIDFWFLCDVKVGEQEILETRQSYQRRTFRSTEDTLVLETVWGGRDTRTRVRMVYAADGALRSYRRETVFFGRGNASLVVGTVVDECLVVTSATVNAEDLQAGPADADADDVRIHQVPLESLQHTVPEQWMPLVFAYHIREGNTRYQFHIARPDAPEIDQRYIVQDQGEETVEIDGQPHTAHRLIVHTIDNPQGPPANMSIDRETYVVLTDGSLVSFHRDGTDYTVLSQRCTAEDVAAVFDLEPDEPQDETQGTGE